MMFFVFDDGSMLNLLEILFISKFHEPGSEEVEEGEIGFYCIYKREPGEEYWFTYPEGESMVAYRDYQGLIEALKKVHPL